MQVSVIIPSFNRGKFLKDAVESIFKQVLPPYEIIVVDDASTDETTHLLEPYLPRIKYIRSENNKGVSSARNTGAKKASGRYLAFLDSDDLFMPHKLLNQLAFMEGKYVASHTDEHWFRKDRFVNQGKQHQKYGGEIFSKILDKCRISPSSFMIEREFFYTLGGFNENLMVCEDYEFFLRLSVNNEIGYLPEKLIIKRAVAANSLSANVEHIEWIRLKILESFAKENKLNEMQHKELVSEIYRKKSIVKYDL